MGLRSGAQRASIPRGVVRGLVAAVLATFIVAPSVVGASSAGTAAATTVTIPYASPTWLSTEQWYLGLVNCTRTGGWVLPDGSCRGYGTGRYSAYVRPLTRSAGISDHVSRPYARLLAVRNLCNHWYDGDPGGRLRRAGYYGYTWGENIGCRWGYSSLRFLPESKLFPLAKATGLTVLDWQDLIFVNQNGQRFHTCSDAGSSAAFANPCMNDDILPEFTLDSMLTFKVPGTGSQKFFVHVLDWRGDARPDMLYQMAVFGAD